LKLPQPLIHGRLIRRYKRFLADVDIDGVGETTVHCPNPGALMGLKAEGSEVWLTPTATKLPYRWLLTRADGALVGIDTNLPNKLAWEALSEGRIPELTGYASMRREVAYGRNSRIDILLEDAARGAAYVEVKNVHLHREAGLAEFPDCVTLRGAKHLDEMADMVRAGHRAVMLYIVQRGDCDSLSLAEDLDPGYAAAFDRALKAGVEALCYACDVTLEAIDVRRRLAFPRALD
jgi:sugar fermentation stimulation protein A